MRTQRIFSGGLLLAVAILLAACATTARERSGGDRNRITADQIEAVTSQYSTAYEVVQNLRPLWLRKRGATSFSRETDIAVYIDGARYGTPDDLRRLSILSVGSMRFLSPSEATNRYGTGHTHGAILVRTKR
jgi:hypothetical protein